MSGRKRGAQQQEEIRKANSIIWGVADEAIKQEASGWGDNPIDFRHYVRIHEALENAVGGSSLAEEIGGYKCQEVTVDSVHGTKAALMVEHRIVYTADNIQDGDVIRLVRNQAVWEGRK